MQVGFIGLGAMGNAMANNLLKAGFALTVYNRTGAKAEALVAKGADLAKAPAEAAQGEMVITRLADDAAVESAVFARDGVLEALSPSTIHISMSTISIALAERLTNTHRAKKQSFDGAGVRPAGGSGNRKALCWRGGRTRGGAMLPAVVRRPRATKLRSRP